MSSAEAWRKEVGGKEELARQITAGVVEKNSALETKKKKKDRLSTVTKGLSSGRIRIEKRSQLQGYYLLRFNFTGMVRGNWINK